MADRACLRRKIRPIGVFLGTALIALGAWMSWNSKGNPSKGEEVALVVLGIVELAFGGTKRVSHPAQ